MAIDRSRAEEPRPAFDLVIFIADEGAFNGSRRPAADDPVDVLAVNLAVVQ